uniref:Activin_recp domain-containing protein n=1 Tax=Angiostrongylus cantonensis TaxID=6313 RepID=A0A0K0DJV4_ANGCA
MASLTLVILLETICFRVALECYAGFKYVARRSIGTSTVTCSSPTDYCYNATADISQLNELSMARCSTTQCFLSRNKCIKQILNGREIKLCCCNSGDLCNSKYSVSFYSIRTAYC